MGTASSTPSTVSVLTPLNFILQVAEYIHEDAAVVCKEKGFKTFASSLRAELFNIIEVLSEISDSEDDEEKRQSVLAVLVNLEQLCQWPLSLTDEDHRRDTFDPRHYPCLNELVTAHGSVQEHIRKVAKDVTARNFRRQILSTLAKFGSTEQIEERPGILELMGSKVTHSQAPEDQHRHLENLYSAVSGFCACKCEEIAGKTVTNLRLNWSDREDHHKISYVSFGLLFLHDHPPLKPQGPPSWQDTRVSIPSQRKTVVHFGNEENPDVSEELIAGSHPMGQFCKLIKQGTRAQLHFIASSQGLQLRTAEQASRSFLTNTESVPLTSLLPSRQLTAKMKVLLSFFIARSVWQFYDSNWMRSWWTNKSVHFMGEYRRPHADMIFINEPFLRIELEGTSIVPDNSAQSEEFQTHLYPKILGLGVMLLEIELGKPIQELCRPDIGSLDKVNDLHMAACDILRDDAIWPPEDIFSDIKEIIRICIEPDLEKLALAPTSEMSRGSADVRARLYNSIVKVLEEFVRQAWDHPDRVKVNPIHPTTPGGYDNSISKEKTNSHSELTFSNYERVMSQIGNQYVRGDVHNHYFREKG